MKITNIIWDTDGYNPQELGLPNEVEISSSIDEYNIADYLSDEYGFLVESFEYETH